MANNFTIGYENAASSPGYVELNYGSPTTNGLIIHASFRPASGFTPTHYKVWGVALEQGSPILTEMTATWQPFVTPSTLVLADVSGIQYAYAKFRDSGLNESVTYQSNGVEFSFIEPTIYPTVKWADAFKDRAYDSSESTNYLLDASEVFSAELGRSFIKHFTFSDMDLSGIKLGATHISVDPDSYFGKVFKLDSSNTVPINYIESSNKRSLIYVEDEEGKRTLTTYLGEQKATVSGTDVGRISGVYVGQGEASGTTYFSIHKFSTYGIAFTQKMEFTTDSTSASYIGESAVIKVYVQDTNGEGVEHAPVELTLVAGDTIGTITQGSINTDAAGIATFSILVNAAGAAEFEAHIYGDIATTVNHSLIGVEAPGLRQRSLLTQYEQIRRSTTYDDSVPGVNTVTVAEPSTSTALGDAESVLEHDLNVLRTLVKQIKGTSNWYDTLPSYFDASNTDELDTANSVVSLAGIAGNTLDSKTILTAISDDNSGLGFALVSGTSGFLFTSTLAYATPTNRLGLPIFNSLTNTGDYFDEGAGDHIVGIDLIDLSTGGEFKDSAGNIIFARFHDGSDFSGSGNGTDVYVKLYTKNGPYTATADDPSSILIVYPYRKRLSDVQEYEWTRTDFVSSWEGDTEIVEDISNLWAYTGALDSISLPTWTNASGTFVLNNNLYSLKSAIDTLNTEFGDRVFTEQNYVTTGQFVTESLNSLDMAMYDMASSIANNVGDKYLEVVSSNIAALSVHTLPAGLNFTPSSDSGRWGKNMDIFVNGQLLVSSTGLLGENYDGDYAEISSTEVVFMLDIYQNSTITYVIRS